MLRVAAAPVCIRLLHGDSVAHLLNVHTIFS